MAKAKKAEEISPVSRNPDVPKPKLTKLIIKIIVALDQLQFN